MKESRLARRVSIILVVILSALGGMASSQEVYVATLTSPKGLGLKKTAELTLTIADRSTEEDRARLLQVFEEKGSEGFVGELRKLEQGVAKITGGPSSRINYVMVRPGQNGSSVVILTESPLYFPEDGPPSTTGSSVGLIRLEVNASGQGRGTMAEAQKLRITQEGTFEVEASRVDPIDLEDVRRER
ncbi:MAG: hypothetical protein ACRD3V_14030 [Vicinamibacteria bacterium]